MARSFIVKARFQRAYDRLPAPERARVKNALQALQRSLETGEAAIGLGLKKLGSGVYEIRVGLALRIVYVEPPGQARGSTASSLDFARDDPSTRAGRHPERGFPGQGRGPSRGVEEGSLLVLALLGSHDEVRRFLRNS